MLNSSIPLLFFASNLVTLSRRTADNVTIQLQAPNSNAMGKPRVSGEARGYAAVTDLFYNLEWVYNEIEQMYYPYTEEELLEMRIFNCHVTLFEPARIKRTEIQRILEMIALR
jgi:hypothetical protein